jgi:hypothetical protein
MWILLPGLLQDETEVKVSARHGEDAQQWLNAAYARRWIRSWGLIAWPSRPPYSTSIDVLLWGHLSCTFIQSLPELSKISWQDITQQKPTSQGVSERMPYRQLTSALKWTETASDPYCSYEAQLFDQLDFDVHVENYTSHDITLYNTFDLFLDKKSHYIQLVHGCTYFHCVQISGGKIPGCSCDVASRMNVATRRHIGQLNSWGSIPEWPKKFVFSPELP